MNTSREAFLDRVRHAVRGGNRAGIAALKPRGHTGYQGAGPDAADRFSAECTAAGGQVHVVSDSLGARARVIQLVRERSPRKVLLGRGGFVDPLDLFAPLREFGMDVTQSETLEPSTARDSLFAAQIGISGVDYLVAETGTVVLRARPAEPRSLSLLPPVHIAVADQSQILPDLFDLFQVLEAGKGAAPPSPALPSCLSLITGPSKTGDIELRLVTGVHGPGEIHVVLVTDQR
jgi:L-lactate utilization protein LutC